LPSPEGAAKKRKRRKKRGHRAVGRHRSRPLDPSRAVAFDKAQLFRDIAAEQRKKAKAKIARHKREILAARTSRKPRLTAAQAQCILDRERARAMCKTRKATVRTSVRTDITTAREALARDKQDAREMRAADRFGRAFAGPKRRRSLSEERSESDDAVRSNIDPDLIPFFNRVRGGIRGTPNMSRTEAFLQLVHESPGDVAATLAEHGEDKSEAMIAEYERRFA
jgi:hypothetical protein